MTVDAEAGLTAHSQCWLLRPDTEAWCMC